MAAQSNGADLRLAHYVQYGSMANHPSGWRKEVFQEEI
jgi:hypothetical protein